MSAFQAEDGGSIPLTRSRWKMGLCSRHFATERVWRQDDIAGRFSVPFGGQKRIHPGFKWSRGILLFIKLWGIICLRSITIKNSLMPNKIEKWEELSREIAFQKYSRKIEKVMDKISDKKER